MFLSQDESKKKLAAQLSSVFKNDTLKLEMQTTKNKMKQKLVKQEKLSKNKIQSLSINTLKEGLFVLGCVREIRINKLIFTLPGGVFGELPFGSVSPSYKFSLREFKMKFEFEEMNPSFKVFHIGETFCCRIIDLYEIGAFYPKVLLSTDPMDVNFGRSHTNVEVGDLLIVSVERKLKDKYVMFTGIQKLTAFLKDNEAVKYIQERNHNRPLVIGQVVRCIVKKTMKSYPSTLVELTANPVLVSQAILEADITIEKLIPTARVKIVIINVHQDGLEVKVLGCPEDITGYVESSHLQSCWSKPEHYVPGTELIATVLYIIPSTKTVFLSLKELSDIIEQKLKKGAIIDDAKVEAVTKEGIEIIIGKKEDELKGYIPVKHIDGNFDPENLPIKYPVGTEFKTRVISFDHICQIYICSLERAFINEKYVVASDVAVGDIIDCRVGEKYLQVGHLNVLAPYVKSDQRKEIDRKMGAGEHIEVKARVLRIHEASGNVFVTLDPVLISCEPLISWEQASKGGQYYGQIVAISNYTLGICFFNDVYGVLPHKYMGYEADVRNDFVKGQAVKCYILFVNCEKKKLLLGFTKIHPIHNVNIDGELKNCLSEELQGDVFSECNVLKGELKYLIDGFISHLQALCKRHDYKTGTRLTGKVASARHDGILVVFEDNVQGILPARLYTKYIPGEEIEVMVLWQNLSNRLLLLQPVGVFVEDQNVDSSNYIIGSHVTGRVLFSDSKMAICVLLGGNKLAYVLYLDRLILPVGSVRRFIVLNIIGHFIICFDWKNVLSFYKKRHRKVPEHILHAHELKIKEEQVGKILEEENKQNGGDNCGSESNKQYKRKSEESFIEGEDAFSVACKKMKNNSLASNKEEKCAVNTESDLSSVNSAWKKELKNRVDRFMSYLRASDKKQDYKTGTKLTGKVVSSKHDVIVVFEGSVKGVMSSDLCNECIPGEDVEVIVLWQHLRNKLLYLQPAGVSLEDHNVKSSNYIIGSHVTGRVLFSDSKMAICELLGENTLAYVLYLDTHTLPLGSNQELIVQSVVDNYIICIAPRAITKFSIRRRKLASALKKQLDKEMMEQIPEEENKQNSEDNCESESNIQLNNKGEESYDDGDVAFSVTNKKMKNNLHVPKKEKRNTISIKSKQKKKKK